MVSHEDFTMATFYVLPARLQTGQHFHEYLASVFPGLGWMRSDWPDLAEALAQAAEAQPGVFVVFAEDLDDRLDVGAALLRGFGAEPGDEVVVVRPGRNLPVVQVERLRVGQPAKAA
jgi:hypothetical protein